MTIEGLEVRFPDLLAIDCVESSHATVPMVFVRVVIVIRAAAETLTMTATVPATRVRANLAVSVISRGVNGVVVPVTRGFHAMYAHFVAVGAIGENVNTTVTNAV